MLSKAQLKQRKKGIGGSEIAELVGLVHYDGSGPWRVWARKVGVKLPKIKGPALDRGNIMGPAIAKLYAKNNGLHVKNVGRFEKTHEDSDFPLCLATPDGILSKTKDSKPLQPFEGKAPGKHTKRNFGEQGTDQIDPIYVPQTQWEQKATGLIDNGCAFGALIDGDVQEYLIPFDLRLFEALYEYADRFWRDHVLTGKEPPIDATKACQVVLNRLHPNTTHDLIEAAAEHYEHLKQLASVQVRIKELEADESLVKNQIRAMIGEYDGIRTDWGPVKYNNRSGKVSHKKGFDQLAERLELTETEKQAILEETRSPDYRHFQWYPNKAGKGIKDEFKTK